MHPKKPQKPLQLPPNTSKKKLIVKSKKLTIDIPTSDHLKEDLHKNSPKHRHYPTSHNSLSSHLTSKPKESAKRSPSSITGTKVFIFPPEPKPLSQSPRKLIKQPTHHLLLAKSKTPQLKKKFPKFIQRQKTTSKQDIFPVEIPESPSPQSGDSESVQKTLAKIAVRQTYEEIYNNHLFQTYQCLRIVQSLPPVDIDQLKEKRITLPRRKGFENKKTVVFDLDETLVHCSVDKFKDTQPDVILPISYPSGDLVEAGVFIRPFTKECLEELNKNFEVFVFTASLKCYGDVVLDYLDPDGQLIHQRFFRENCLNVNGVFVKDLRIFANRKLSDIVIVDNAAYSYAYQIDNGIPIISWTDEKDDKELLYLVDYLNTIVCADDVREANFQSFRLRTFCEDYSSEYLIE